MSSKSTLLAKLAKIYGIFTIIFCVIAIIGLFGLNFFIKSKNSEQENIQGSELGIFLTNQASNPRKITQNKPIRGSELGIFIGESFSYPTNPEIKGGQNAVFVSTNFAYKEPIYSPEFEPLLVLKEITNVLSLDISQQFNHDYDRGLAIDEHLVYLKSLQQKGLNELNQVSQQRATTEEKLNITNEKVKNVEANFFAYLEQMHAENSEIFFKEYKQERQKAVIFRADLGYLLAVEQRLAYNIELLQNRIVILENNRQNLICGVR